jgi:hypothetical protein
LRAWNIWSTWNNFDRFSPRKFETESDSLRDNANVKSGMKRGYAAGGKKISSRKVDLLIAGPPRIELKFDDI